MTRRLRLWALLGTLLASGCVVGGVGEYKNLAPGIDLPTVDTGSGGSTGTGGSSSGGAWGAGGEPPVEALGGGGSGSGGAGGAELGGAGGENDE